MSIPRTDNPKVIAHIEAQQFQRKKVIAHIEAPQFQRNMYSCGCIIAKDDTIMLCQWHDGYDEGLADAETGGITRHLDVEQACEIMHDAYEKAAVGAGWETNPASRKPWADVPAANKTTMRAAVGTLLEAFANAEQETP